MKALITGLVCLSMVACALPGGGTQSPSNPATTTAGGGFGAQTNTGTQGQAQTPQTASAGPAAINWYFASQVSSEIQKQLLDLATTMKWTAEQTIAALQATNGAPTNVTITNRDQVVTTGNPDNTGASGGTGQGGTAGPVQKP